MTSLFAIQVSEKRAKQKEYPVWVSQNNLSLKAYLEIEKLQKERLGFISIHNKVSDFKIKKNWQISAGDVARGIGAAKQTLISTSAYSKDLKGFLDSINDFLNLEKEKKLNRQKNPTSG